MALAIQIKGIDNVEKFLKNTNKEILSDANNAIKKAGFHVQAEVQQSIAGRKAEPRSVDTGRFLGSVKTEQKKPLTATIFTNVPYAKVLEYGSDKRQARRHFTNTSKREQNKVKTFVEKEIKKSL